MGELTYRTHQARRARKLAAIEEFQDADGNPDFVRISSEVGVTTACARYILTGELPASASADSEDIFE